MTALFNIKQFVEEPAEQSAGINPSEEALNKLRKISLSEADIQERLELARDARFIAGKLALKGQITVFFAGPNTGKTLLSLALLSEARREGLIDEEIYHLNLDDDYLGATTKAQLGLQNDFHVITNEKFTDPPNHFIELVHEFCQSGAASKTILILDTVKKFTDVMNKGAVSAFMNLCRQFTQAGGTIILLAHTNKIKDEESTVIPGGTSDLLDDCCCAYILYKTHEENTEKGIRKYVTFEQKKSRGPNIQEAFYSYLNNEEGDYFSLFNSVKNESPGAVKQAQKHKAIAEKQEEDAELIRLIKQILSNGEIAQTALVEQVKKQHSASRKQVIKCLNQWNIPSNDGGLWNSYKGDNNSIIYELT